MARARWRALGLALGLGLAAAAAAKPPDRAAPAAPAGQYAIPPGAAHLLFRVRRFGIADSVGRFDAVTGALAADPAAPDAGTLRIRIATAGVRAEGAMLTRILRGPDFFDVARYPEIRFAAANVAVAPGRTIRIQGMLTIRGITHPASFEVGFDAGALDAAGGRFTLGFVARGTIRRSDYGMTAYRPWVGDAVRLELDGVLATRLGAR